MIGTPLFWTFMVIGVLTLVLVITGVFTGLYVTKLIFAIIALHMAIVIIPAAIYYFKFKIDQISIGDLTEMMENSVSYMRENKDKFDPLEVEYRSAALGWLKDQNLPSSTLVPETYFLKKAGLNQSQTD